MKKTLHFSLALILSASAFISVYGKKQDVLPENKFASYFEKAYQLHPGIPKGVLEAVAFTNTRFQHLTHTATDAKSCIGIPEAYGVMGLTLDGKNYFSDNLVYVANLSGYSVDEVKNNPEKNILAYAKAFELLMNSMADSRVIESNDVENIGWVLSSLSELPHQNAGQSFAFYSHIYSCLSFMNDPSFQVKYNFPNYNFNLQKYFGENYEILSASRVAVSSEKVSDSKGNILKEGTLPGIQSPDYPPALWNQAASCNFSSRSGTPVSAVTIHTVQGSYAGCISWFQNCNASVSAHYVVRSSDGQITQMVYEASKGWHVGSENPYTIGIEHEGYVNNASWYTTNMYTESANLCADICASGYGIPPLRTGFQPWMPSTYYNQAGIPGSCTKIKGHMHYPNQSHTDPGPNWNWDYFYKLINPQPAPTTLTTGTGTFYDSGGAGGNYGDDERLVWVISPGGATSVTLTFSSFDLENTWDYMYVYDGSDVWAPLIGYYTGTTNPGTLIANSGTMTVEFRSDCATTAAGWNASWTSNSTTVTPANLSSALWGCPNDGVTFNWQNSGNGWFVDVSDDPNFSYFWNKDVTGLTTVNCPGGFALNTNPNDFLGFQPSTTYYWRIWDGVSQTAGNPFTTPNCVYMNTTCSGTFDDTGGPAAAYSGNEDYTTIIQPASASSVTMTFTSFDLETNFDSLWIWDGLPNSSLIGTYTGTNSPGTVTANTAMMSLRFKADPFVNNAGWTATWSCVSTTGTNEQNNSDAVIIFPNPFSEFATIQILNYNSQTTGFKLFDVFGREVRTMQLETSSIKLERGSLASGMYFYELYKGEGISGKGKLIIE